MAYSITLQTAVNRIVQDVWDMDVLFVVSLGDDGSYWPAHLCIDKTALVSFDFADNGICLELYTPEESVYNVIIPYERISEIVAFYDNFRVRKNLYYQQQSTQSVKTTS